MGVGLDVPQTVGLDRVLVARNLLLLEAPLGEFDLTTNQDQSTFRGRAGYCHYLVREQITPLQRMPQPENRPNCPKPSPGGLILTIPILDLHDPIIVCVTNKTGEPITRHLILEIDIADGRTDVMGVQALERRDVFQADLHVVGDPGDGLGGVVVVRGAFDVGVREPPGVIVVSVRV